MTSIIRDNLAIIALRQKAKDIRIDRFHDWAHAAIAKNELADAQMMAAELPARIVLGNRNGEIRAAGPGVARRIVPVINTAVPGRSPFHAGRHMLFAHEQRVAEAIGDFGKANPNDGPKGAVLRQPCAIGKRNARIKPGGANRGSIITRRDRRGICQNSLDILGKRLAQGGRISRRPVRGAEIERDLFGKNVSRH